MEMRAEEDINLGEDVTPQILPIAFSLSQPFLLSRCSSCFLPLNYPQTTPAIKKNTTSTPLLACNSHPNFPLIYCSQTCHDADSDRHLSTGECQLLQSPPSTCHSDDISTLRVALRLLLSFETLEFGFSFIHPRVRGLMSNREKFARDDENLARIRDGARAMSVARKMRDGVSGLGENAMEEETALCLVLTNAVEVQVSGGGGAVGIAVYGPHFSWFNHSCTPNACYRFALPRLDGSGFGESDFRVFASGEEDNLKKWISDVGKLSHDLCKYGPRVIVRSIRPIRKGEEVCVAYTDLLQPKVLRQSELWSKYRFVCCCNRCTIQPPTYVDRCLHETVASLKASFSSLDHDFYECKAGKELTDCLDQAIEHIAEGDPKACCERLENMFAENFQYGQLRSEPFLPSLKLQPLHHISLNAYITLASTYRIRASSILALDSGNQDNQLEAFELSRAAAAYSLLLAGATNHLFSFDSSLIASTAQFWVSAGETLLGLLGSPIWTSTIKNSFKSHISSLGSSACVSLINSELDMFCCHSQAQKESTISWDRFDVICKGFIDCILRASVNVWPFLIHSLPCLKDIKNPVDFRWLGMTDTRNTAETDVTVLGSGVGICSQNGDVEKYIEGEERVSVFQLGTHSLLYGRYLAGICFGPHCYLTD